VLLDSVITLHIPFPRVSDGPARAIGARRGSFSDLLGDDFGKAGAAGV
jgi:hypothetical protein